MKEGPPRNHQPIESPLPSHSPKHRGHTLGRTMEACEAKIPRQSAQCCTACTPPNRTVLSHNSTHTAHAPCQRAPACPCTATALSHRQMYLTCADSVVCLVFAATSFLSAEYVMPLLIGNLGADALIIDSLVKFDALLGKEQTIEQEVRLLNLTNAHDLMTQNPAPVPIFQEVVVNFQTKAHFFDFMLSSDKSTYGYKAWSHITTSPPSDKDVSFVTVNTVLVGLMGAFGGEAGLQGIHDGALAAGQAVDPTNTDPTQILTAGCMAIMPTGLQSCLGAAFMYASLAAEKQLPLNPDGTGALNVGLFVKRTVDELINGYMDPLTQQAIPGLALGFNKYQTLAGLQQAISLGLEDPAAYEMAKETGRSDSNSIGKYVSIRTYSQTNATHNNAMWAVDHPAYDNTGRTGPERSPSYTISGQRSSSQPLAPLSKPPSVFLTGYPPLAAPSAERFSYFEELLTFRALNYSCGECKHEILHGVLGAVKYTMDDSNGWLRVDGVKDESGACATSMPACDYGTIHPSTFRSSVMTYSLPYFGKSSPELIAKATFKNAAGHEVAFNDATMRNEMYIEPFTGVPVKVRTMMQSNVEGVNAQLFGGTLYPNVFSGDSFPSLFPVSITVTSSGVSEHDAFKLSSAMSYSYMVMLFCNVGGFGFLASAVWALRRSFQLKAVKSSPWNKA